ncbi:(+)-cis,trans-nepetalactol synthase NEPS2-like [Juglans microcarpa x Juglans regia]|uniref:(+)-cis,trans-nepetalactol synthase NEPS2-like n=1 Tax=Juglans microcarpa x Juglans regia TaxID=2249226 RepID=UPI001B7ED8C2|nr:(+)-cis,trans-nepetalactol synthase NEPS2-like [Juglans microcarpa x Juglans regia]
MTDSTVGNHRSLKGKVAIITGGASGIGEATARLFTQHGTRMVVIADIQDQLGKQVASSIGIDKCSYVHCDVSDEDQVKSTVESTVEKYGQLDIMFSNAGILSSSEQSVLELDILRFDRLFAVNVRGMALCVKHAARAMVEGGVRGSIICTGSVAASHGAKARTDYCMTKHAVLGLVRSASLQVGEHGIRVNSISPNGLATPLTCRMQGKSVEEVEKVYEPFARLKGVSLKVEHVADAVLFLACNEFVSGHDLVVDGVFVPRSSTTTTTT